ncbi:MAG: hypothetical protein JO241_10320 [Candidatus Eremiobacteraeota bacterium]|nr:hypothetical protein [Candidatus Eremiobacteraeota bacterium]
MTAGLLLAAAFGRAGGAAFFAALFDGAGTGFLRVFAGAGLAFAAGFLAAGAFAAVFAGATGLAGARAAFALLDCDEESAERFDVLFAAPAAGSGRLEARVASMLRFLGPASR